MTKTEWLSFWNLSGEEGERIWLAKVEMHEHPIQAPMVISEERNYKPYKSMITGEVIEGKKAHREHLIKHNKIEVGNEKIPPKPPKDYSKVDEGLKRTLYQIADSKLK